MYTVVEFYLHQKKNIPQKFFSGTQLKDVHYDCNTLQTLQHIAPQWQIYWVMTENKPNDNFVREKYRPSLSYLIYLQVILCCLQMSLFNGLRLKSVFSK